MKNRMRSFGYAIVGLKVAFKEEPNFRIHMLALLGVGALGLYVDLSPWEWISITLVAGLVIVTELLNTAVEHICDYLNGEHDLRIGVIKDIAAAAVLVSAITAFVVGVLVFYPHI